MAPLELTHLAGNTWYIPAPSNIGLYVRETEVFLIDSGNDKDAGRQINKLITERGWTLRMIVNTHSNADHIGGNAFLQNKTGCSVAATRKEAPFIEYPELEPSFLYGGYPSPAMRNKFLLAKPSRVTDLIEEEGPVPGTPLTALSLPGHFFGMIGVRTPDGVLFTADALFPPSVLRKYHLFFLYDITAQFSTLERLENENAEIFVPGHGEPTGSLASLIAENREKIREILSFVTELCAQGRCFDDLLAETARHFDLTMDPNQYILIGSSLRSYLSCLCATGELEHLAEGGTMIWKRRSL